VGVTSTSRLVVDAGYESVCNDLWNGCCAVNIALGDGLYCLLVCLFVHRKDLWEKIVVLLNAIFDIFLGALFFIFATSIVICMSSCAKSCLWDIIRLFLLFL